MARATTSTTPSWRAGSRGVLFDNAVLLRNALRQCGAGIQRTFHEAHERVTRILPGKIQPADAVVERRPLAGDLSGGGKRVGRLRPRVPRPIHEPRAARVSATDPLVNLAQLGQVVLGAACAPIAADLSRRTAGEAHHCLAGT